MDEVMYARYENPYKVIVNVMAIFHTDGYIEPRAFVWEDGQTYEINGIKDVTRAASLKAGGAGVRYTIEVCVGENKDRLRKTYLFHEENHWFMERNIKVPVLDVHGRLVED